MPSKAGMVDEFRPMVPENELRPVNRRPARPKQTSDADDEGTE